MTLCPSRIWRIAWAVLLALSVATAWSSGSMAAGSHATQVHAHASAYDAPGHSHHSAATAQAELWKSAGAAGIACCPMTTCHPAVPVLPVWIAHAASGGPAQAGPFPHPDGDEPSPALPPPRLSQV